MNSYVYGAYATNRFFNAAKTFRTTPEWLLFPLPATSWWSLFTPYISGCVACGPCYASCWPKMTIDCSANAFVIRLGWILHLNHFIIYVPYSCQCHLEAESLVIHHTLSLAVVINIVMGWTFTMKLPGGREYRSPPGGSGHSIQESTEGRLSGVLGTRRTLQRCR